VSNGLEKILVNCESSGAWVDVEVVNLDIVLEYLYGEARENDKAYTYMSSGR